MGQGRVEAPMEGVIFIAANIPPVSTNNATANGRNGGRFKSGEYKRYTTDLLELLSHYEEEKKNFISYFEGKAFYFKSDLKVYIPEDYVFTKKHDISNRKGDNHNYRKCTQDIVHSWLGYDDKYEMHGVNSQHVDEQGMWGFTYRIEAVLRKHRSLAPL